MSTPATAPEPGVGLPSRRFLRDELVIVLLLSIGASALQSLVSLIDRLTRQVSLSDQTAVIVGTYSQDRPWLDLTYQLLNVALALVPVALVWYLMRRNGEGGLAGLGVDLRQPRRDLLRGAVLAAVIGGSGLVLYVVAYHLGLSVKIAAASTIQVWWTVPLLLVQAGYNALLEEVITLGYVIRRLDQLGARPWVSIGSSALLRGCYHLYQGFGGFVGNVVMGLLFGWLFRRWGRAMPMVVAHFLIDAVGFVGYYYLHGKVGWLP